MSEDRVGYGLESGMEGRLRRVAEALRKVAGRIELAVELGDARGLPEAVEVRLPASAYEGALKVMAERLPVRRAG
jgi:vacuolar-type H+-ATPase catalytic subunit A/Vma1